jgi:hypothetical protein
MSVIYGNINKISKNQITCTGLPEGEKLLGGCLPTSVRGGSGIADGLLVSLVIPGGEPATYDRPIRILTGDYLR